MKLLVTISDALDPGFGRIAAVDLEHESAEIVLEWCPPPSLRTSGKGFLGLAWLGAPGQSDLIACAHAGLCRINPTTWTVSGVLHQPCMNDLHHVTVHEGRLLVTNTGLDRVDVFELSGRFIGAWDQSPAWLTAERLRGCNPSRESWNSALDRGWALEAPSLTDEPFTGDLQSLAADSIPFHARKTRHFVHPNHITMLDRRPILTRFIDRSIQDLSDWSFPIPETPGHPHDGIVCGDRFWITCTTGLVVAYAIENGRLTSREVERIDIPQRTGRCGWCRGLIVTDQLLVVSLTTVRYMPPYGWADSDLSKTETSILAVDRNTFELAARVDCRSFGQLPKLFGMVEWPATRDFGKSPHAI
ncbi:MAG: hypothetical protein K2Y71_20040 [Xanthobacteraceae bacterium]|nr:hypothetical protein [Xanthobacteraceae bacterium]